MMANAGLPKRQVGSHLARTVSSLLDLVYPPRCIGCGVGISASEQPLCLRCMVGLERVDQDELRSHVFANVPAFAAASVFALWMFDKGGILQRAQHQLKYGRRPTYGRALGRALGAGWVEFTGLKPDLVMPIPLHRARYLERGYNQSATLAEGVAEVIERPLDLLSLRRTAPTKRQTGLSRDARQENVSRAFEANGAGVDGKSVLIIDDVITTGATAAAVVDALMGADSGPVHFAALAHART